MRHRCMSVTVQPACHPSIPLPSLRLNASQISSLRSELPCTMSSCLLLKLDACASLRLSNGINAACRWQSSRHPMLLPCCSFHMVSKEAATGVRAVRCCAALPVTGAMQICLTQAVRGHHPCLCFAVLPAGSIKLFNSRQWPCRGSTP